MSHLHVSVSIAHASDGILVLGVFEYKSYDFINIPNDNIGFMHVVQTGVEHVINLNLGGLMFHQVVVQIALTFYFLLFVTPVHFKYHL